MREKLFEYLAEATASAHGQIVPPLRKASSQSHSIFKNVPSHSDSAAAAAAASPTPATLLRKALCCRLCSLVHHHLVQPRGKVLELLELGARRCAVGGKVAAEELLVRCHTRRCDLVQLVLVGIHVDQH